MGNPVLKILSDNGMEVLFDSWNDDVLFWVDERVVTASSYTNRQVVYSYPQWAGRKIMAFLSTPYNAAPGAVYTMPSCRVGYSGAVPTVTVFLDDNFTGLPIANGLLTVMLSGDTL